jgi:hypothetical protein
VTAEPSHRLRGTTLLAAPLFLIGLIGASVALATALWGLSNPGGHGAVFAVTLVGGTVLGAAGLGAARGCFVETGAGSVRDVVGWVTVRRLAEDRVVEARVRSGPWRWFELELDDGTLVTLVGAGPVQFPSHLLPGARERDLSDLAALRGEPAAVRGEPA